MKSLPALLLACLAIIPVSNAMADAFEVSQRTLSWHPTQDDGDSSWLRSEWGKGSIVMPFVVSPHAEIAARINDTLYLDLVGVPAPAEPGKSFALPKGYPPGNLDDFPLEGTSSLEFTVLRNDGRILSLSIDREGCGAYCESYATPYNFDATSGRSFTARDVFTHAGQLQIAKLVAQERKRQYAAMIKQLKAQLAALGKSGKADKRQGDRDDLKERLELNEDCLARIDGDSPGDPLEYFDYLKFAIPDDHGVQFTSERCSNHASRALDDVGDISLGLPDDKLRGMLTAYGQYLFFGGDKPKQASSPFGVPLHGKIGQAPMTIRLQPDAQGHVAAMYYYDKYRSPIALTGSMDGDHIVLNTPPGKDTQAAEPETFELVRHGGAFSGQWRKQDAQRPVSFGL